MSTEYLEKYIEILNEESAHLLKEKSILRAQILLLDEKIHLAMKQLEEKDEKIKQLEYSLSSKKVK